MEDKDYSDGGGGHLYDQDTRNRSIDLLSLISRKLISSQHSFSDDGLYSGRAGIALFLFHYNKFLKDDEIENQAFSIVQEACGTMNSFPKGASFRKGLTGLGWLILHLSMNGFFEIDVETLTEWDDLIKGYPITNLLNFSVSEGLIGYGMYYLWRLKDARYSLKDSRYSDSKKILECQDQLLQIVNYLEIYFSAALIKQSDFLLKPDAVRADNIYNAYIPFLCNVLKLNPGNEEMLMRIKVGTQRLLESRQEGSFKRSRTEDGLSAVYDELLFANSMLAASKYADDGKLSRIAFDIVERTISMPYYCDTNFSLGTGNAGIFHLYNRFYHHYKDPLLLNTIRQRLTTLVNELIPVVNDSNYDKPGFLDGLAGVGLAILATISEEDPTWDQPLLIFG